MATWSSFYPYTAIYTAGLPNPVIDEHIRMACIDFCTRAMVDRQTLTSVPTVAAQKLYSFPITAEQNLVQLVSATLAGVDLPLTSPEELGADGQTPHGEPAIFATNRKQFWLTQLPTQAGVPVVCSVTLTPSLTATGVTDAIFDIHAQAISQGALASLLLLPGDTANPGLSDRMSGKFEQAITDAAFSPNRAFNRAVLRVKPI